LHFEDRLLAGKHVSIFVKDGGSHRQLVPIAFVSLAELEFLYPYVRDDGQVHSARAFEELGLAFDW
jgi:hypothetical protein